METNEEYAAGLAKAPRKTYEEAVAAVLNAADKASDQRDAITTTIHANSAILGRLTFTEVDNLHRALGLQRK